MKKQPESATNITRDIHINVFHTTKDNQVKPNITTWENIIKLFSGGHQVNEEKGMANYFNGSRYKEPSDIEESSDKGVNLFTSKPFTKRRQTNIIETDLLILDYDGGTTLQKEMERFKQYEYIYYTSFRHLYDGETHKFRIVIPLSKSIPSWKSYNQHGVAIDGGQWYQITESLKNFVGPCDPKSFDPNQIFEMPSVPEERKSFSRSGHSTGQFLDWEQFKVIPFNHLESEISQSNIFSSSLTKSSDEYLDPDQFITTSKGLIKVSQVEGFINGVTCPFHADKNGSEIVRKVESTGNIFIYCSTCQRKYYMQRSVFSRNNKQKKKSPRPMSGKHYTADELLEFPPISPYIDASSRDRVNKQLEKIQRQIKNNKGKLLPYGGRQYKSHILYMPEGSGKSYLVVKLAKEGHKIIFACKSWEQVESKYEEYSKYGLKHGYDVRVVRSKDAKTRRRFNTKAVREAAKKPYSMSSILESETLELAIINNPKLTPEFIRLTWRFFETDKMEFGMLPEEAGVNGNSELTKSQAIALSLINTNIILTTFEQLRIHKLKNTSIPDEWLVWFDDPDISDVINIEPYDTSKWGELSEQELEKETLDINGKTYFNRNHNQSLGATLKNHKCVYTTTEIITRKAIELLMKRRDEEFIVHDEMDKIAGGIITILGSEKVRKRYDGIIPPITRRLDKLGYPTTLIADGLSSTFNHSNNKGRNDLSKTNILVELSIPHPIQIRTICDALNLKHNANKQEIRANIMLDRLHQAIGRNSGYRQDGFESVVLVDKQVHKKIVSETRYKIDIKNSVIIDRTNKMSRKDSRLISNVSPLVNEIENLLLNVDGYVSDKRKIKPDIKFIINEIKDIQKQRLYITRLLTSLIELSGLTQDDLRSDENHDGYTLGKYLDVIKWILKEWIPEKDRSDVIESIYESD